jgi:hypothetical protein
MNDSFSAERLGRDTDNPVVANADVAHGVKAGFGIEDASAIDHEI